MGITCCDIEPASLARNILLFSLLDDGNETTALIWDTFYHFKVNDRISNVIERQSRKLCDLAQDIRSWRQSPYGSFLKMIDTRSLTELRRYWKHYADFSRLPIDRRNRLLHEQSELTRTVINKGDAISPSRSAGMLLSESLFHASEMFQHYWQTGTTYTELSESGNATNLNPTFCYSRSGETFAPHSGTFPQGFHLAPAFAPIAEDPVGALPGTGSPIINKSKQQFAAWCLAFRAARAANAITLHLYCGDAFAFCRALYEFKIAGNTSPGLFSSAFRGTSIVLDGLVAATPPAPLSFDVIDTSSLAGRVGLLNLLIVASPLLKENPASQSVLYTTLLFRSEDDPIKSFLEHVCTDIPTLAALLRIAPRTYLSSFTAQSNIHEMVFSNKKIHSMVGVTKGQRDQYHERIAWTNPCGGDPHASGTPIAVSFEAESLAHILFGMYNKMFAHERPSYIEASNTASELDSLSRVGFHRESVAHLFKAIQRRVHLRDGTWGDVVNKFLETCFTSEEEYPTEPDYYQDLSLQLHLAGIFTPDALQPDWSTRLRVAPRSPLLGGWESLPPVVCVVLTVPRRRLAIFRDNIPCINNLAMQCCLSIGTQEHHHTSIHTVWGRCFKPQDSHHFVVEEDISGIRGHSNLIVTFWASTCLLESPDLQVALSLKSTPNSAIAFYEILGPDLRVYKTSITDKYHVTVLPYCPTATSEPLQYPPSCQDPDPLVSTCRSEHVCQALATQTASSHVGSLSIRFDVTSPEEQKSLLEGARVWVKQISPCTMQLKIGTYTHPIAYPYPVQGRNPTVRIARKSQYIEVIVPVSMPLDHMGYFMNPFPVVGQHAHTAWNLHNLNLDCLPLLDAKTPTKLDWVNPLCAYQLSDTERRIRNGHESEQRKPENALIKLKDRIHSIAMHYLGENVRQGRTIVLCDGDHPGEPFAMILIGGIRLDLASMTIALDTAVIPATSDQPELGPLLGLTQILNPRSIIWLHMSRYETITWKKALPAFIERCRTWSHKPSCEYHIRGEIPLSTEFDKNFICGCGQGIGLAAPQWNRLEWKALIPSAIRAAISPIFPLAYIENA
ncbi:hypothetical protein FRC11_009379 [Ceratobasidium sp. 423]|nr:hypothetical protein FRC11_009379 [Ceratobasidium sp. 423]